MDGMFPLDDGAKWNCQQTPIWTHTLNVLALQRKSKNSTRYTGRTFSNLTVAFSLPPAHNIRDDNTATLDLHKENRPPRGMFVASAKTPAKSATMEVRSPLKSTTNDGKTPGQHTPGRKGRTSNQYFDVGKVGRKTGITLKDTGIRDENGMEPMAGLFDSPAKAAVEAGSGMLESSGRDVDETLHLRKTPRLPPPRASTPKHTNIGSPKRMSSVRPQSRAGEDNRDAANDVSPSRGSHAPANRVLDFSRNGVRMSIENVSPFKPKKTLRRSIGGARQDPFASNRGSGTPPQDSSDEAELPDVEGGALDEQDEQTRLDEQLADDVPLFNNDDDDYGAHPSSATKNISEAVSQAEIVLGSPSLSSAIRHGSAKSRKSTATVNTSAQFSPPFAYKNSRTSTSRKRSIDQTEMSEAVDEDSSQISAGKGTSSSKRRRSKASKSDLSILQDAQNSTIDPSLLAQDEDTYLAPVPEEEEQYLSHSTSRSPNAAPAQRASKPPPTRKPKPAASRRAASTQPLRDRSPSTSAYLRSPSRRATSVSNVVLRACTPFEDTAKTTRSGRAVMQPLKYWAGESYVWKNGEVEGIIRADEVKTPKKTIKRSKKRKTARKTGLASIAEEGDSDAFSGSEDEDEDAPDDWETSLGVIAGTVASWPPNNPSEAPETYREDIAFASSAIITREVAGAAFSYAKIMTLPFFGAGLVEIPPGGEKRAKNAQKMQMVFFVHKGKVSVTVGPGQGEESNEFSVTRGGVWVVPRGNTYSITNESASRTARVFFAQGCEVEAGSLG